MCEGQHDNIKKVWKCLKGYQDARAYIPNLKADIADLEAEISLAAAPKTTSFSATGGCGSGEQTSIEEQTYFKREKMQERLALMKQKLRQLERETNCVTRTLASLATDDQKLIERRVFHNDSWILIASNLNTSPSSCRRRLNAIMETLAIRMFGPDDVPIQTNLRL